MRAAAYTGPFPVRFHRTMAEVMSDEAGELRGASLVHDERVARRMMAAGSSALLSAIRSARP